ncbi:MAG: hypothetical protein INH41_10665 [Myxococcaceae bacterium]|jgi:hypothetical protein|nr:hypothetical protein [Myxococcaceae bacterium]MCA3012847.1 hypothetical protein [Myxococcaceae bacterium]
MLTPEEQAALEKMKADVKKAPTAPRAPPGTVRPERFSDFAPGMGDDGTLNEVDPATGAVKPRKLE